MARKLKKKKEVRPPNLQGTVSPRLKAELDKVCGPGTPYKVQGVLTGLAQLWLRMTPSQRAVTYNLLGDPREPVDDLMKAVDFYLCEALIEHVPALGEWLAAQNAEQQSRLKKQRT